MARTFEEMAQQLGIDITRKSTPQSGLDALREAQAQAGGLNRLENAERKTQQEAEERENEDDIDKALREQKEAKEERETRDMNALDQIMSWLGKVPENISDTLPGISQLKHMGERAAVEEQMKNAEAEAEGKQAEFDLGNKLAQFAGGAASMAGGILGMPFEAVARLYESGTGHPVTESHDGKMEENDLNAKQRTGAFVEALLGGSGVMGKAGDTALGLKELGKGLIKGEGIKGTPWALAKAADEAADRGVLESMGNKALHGGVEGTAFGVGGIMRSDAESEEQGGLPLDQ